MEALIVIAFLAPLVLLIWAMVRHAGRIRWEVLDRDLRHQQLEQINPALAKFVLERDRHTCQQCGATEEVGIDFRDVTLAEDAPVTADDLEARCGRCFQRRWETIGASPDRRQE